MTMDKPMNVCVLVGSLRKASLNGMLANTLISLAPSSMNLEIAEIGQLPFFNQDLETAATPPQWTAFRQRVKAADAVLFAMSAMPTSCSMNRAGSSTRVPENFCRSSCRHSQNGSRRPGLRASASGDTL